MHRCLVTGSAGGGIGEHVARRLAERGHAVCLHGRSADKLALALSKLPETIHPHTCFELDLADGERIEPELDSLQARWGPIDILVSNAAPSFPGRPMHLLSASQWRQELTEVLHCQFALCKAVLPGMVERRFGRLVFISSSAATRGSFGRSAAYAAGKAGLAGLACQLALEYARSGITANAIVPGQIDTPRIRAGGRRSDESLARYAADHVPVGRVGFPADIVSAVEFLIECAYITGQQIVVDGGSSLASLHNKPCT
jgi:3-oxoacyl-[acyl-carrier protein] reductase